MVALEGLVLALPNGVVRPALSAVFTPGVSLVCGDEGTGKTTLLRVLAHQAVRQDSVRGGSLHTPPTEQVFLVDPANLSPDSPLNAMGVGEYWRTQAQQYPGWREDVLQEMASALGLVPHKDKSLFMLSTGSRRKVMLAASIASAAPLVLWDQPFASLDLASVKVLKDVLQQAPTQQRTYVLADYLPPEGVRLNCTLSLD